MQLQHKIVDFSMRYPKAVIAATIFIFLALGLQIPRIVIDTDPENMLPADQGARVFHNKVKNEFTLYDMIVVGIVNENDPDGVFNPASLRRIHELTAGIEKIDGVIRQDLMSLSTVDDISQDGPGVVRFEWLMKSPPETREHAHFIRAAAERNPALRGTLISEDGKAAAIYVPIIEKSESHRIATEIEKIVAGFDGDDQFHITGLPVAEDTFGVEMFKQMAIAAPLAGLIIFLLMWLFFRSLVLIVSPMLLAIVTVTATMGLLIGLGFTVHIMSSMIPIFLMPIAVVDSVHILSEFADLYPRLGDRQKTIRFVMNDLYKPMLFTSLTSAVGFISLISAPIPPVRVFGIFVAFGIMLAFGLTVTFIPAYVVRLSDSSIAKLKRLAPERHEHHLLGRILAALGPKTLSASKLIVFATAIIVFVSIWGVTKIQINDNPVRWFRPDHRIRIADRVLNQHFGGTYNAFLVLSKSAADSSDHRLNDEVLSLLNKKKSQGKTDLTAEWHALHESALAAPANKHLDALSEAALLKLDEAGDEEFAIWNEVLAHLDETQTRSKFFQTPEALQYIEGLQNDLLRSQHVGKSNSIVDIVKTVHRELREGDQRYFSIPDNSRAVAQTLLSYQSSHRPQDLWHFLKPDHREANIWLQLKSGDNQDMQEVNRHVQRYLEQNPPPPGVTMAWAGLTYLNVVWQQEMVNGMFKSLLGSFVIVFIMMLILFRSLWFGLLAMLPLSVTIVFIYGLIGWAGKDYDMPIAVLSSLTLGLSVDFAIHFLQRAREFYKDTGNWRETVSKMFAEPSRAISRNAIVIAVGFLPLLGSPLVPYNTVGFFLAAIMTVSCVVTLILLPSMMHLLKNRLFKKPVELEVADEMPKRHNFRIEV